MQTHQKASKHEPNQGQKPTQPSHPVIAEKLAAFIQLHHHKETAKSTDGRHFVELKGDDKHVAEHLGITTGDLELSYGALTKDLVVKRHGAHRIEILNSAKLAEMAKRSK